VQSTTGTRTTLHCSFCGKSQHEVRKLIAGPTVFICDECTILCLDVLKDEGLSDYKGDEFNLNISKSTLAKIEDMTFPSLEAFFANNSLVKSDDGSFTGDAIFKAVRRVLLQRFRDTRLEENRQNDIAATLAKISEIERTREEELAPLRAQVEALRSGAKPPVTVKTLPRSEK
jgi:hypothetical protein